MRTRAGIILIEENKLALIERHRQGLHYFAFPGGGIDDGESAEEAAIREAKEELGVEVEIQKQVAEIVFKKGRQIYFLVNKVNGEFGSGTGEEYGKFDPEHGTYLPIWMLLEDILKKNVVPRELAELVATFNQHGWVSKSVIIMEET